MGDLIFTLLVWVTSQMGLSMPPSPIVEIHSKERMSELAYGRAWRPVDDVPAAYNRDTAVIYLRDDWRFDDLRSRARLLHELVHHVQTYHRLEYPCPAAREPDAYRLTLRWLEEQGAEDPYAALGIDELSIFIFSRCPDQG